MKLKIDIHLSGEKLQIKTVQDLLLQCPDISCEFYPVWELGEPKQFGPLEQRGMPHDSGNCWITSIFTADAHHLIEPLRLLGVEEFSITVQQSDVASQEGYMIDKDLIQLAAKMDAYVDICDF